MSVQLADFATPDKGGPTKMPATAATAFTQKTTTFSTSVTPADVKKVTPNMSTSSTAGKHVRFGAEDNTDTVSSGDSNNKRGLVSRRGGRYVSPGRPPVVTNPTAAGQAKEASSVLEYKTYNQDSVPAISTTNSVGLVSLPSSEGEKEKTPLKSEVQTKLEEFEGRETATVRPSSITCASTIGPTSPLARTSSPHKDSASFEVRSPVPSQLTDRFKKTPTKSPSHFQSLPSLDDAKLGSPVGFMLSPGPATPSYKAIRDSLEKEDKEAAELGDEIRDYTKEKFALTPTNFSTDYGKSSGMTFDTSNVLNWLQSPTANGLFSPGGGLNSIMNTPRGPLVPRTPGTPTVSTSFFFSDVASLARNGDTPKKGDGDPGKSPKKGLSNIICISPLASTRNRYGGPNATKSPVNFHDIFASPNPLLDDSPPIKGLAKRSSGEKKDPSIDALTLAERDLMQDEDLSVLLQLAGGNTPKALSGRHSKTNSPSGRVFRPSGSRKGDDQENLPGLQLPIIGDRQGDSTATRLSRKTQPREGGDVVKPSLGIRKSTSNAHDNDVFAQKESASAPPPMARANAHPGQPVGSSDVNATKEAEAKPAAATAPQPYAVHSRPYHPRPDVYGAYPGFPPSGMRPSGRMSVVVGGPPPSSRTTKSNSAPRGHLPPHRRPSYSHSDYPPPGMYPPPHAHYPPPHMTGMGHHPSYHPYSAPRHHQPPASRLPVYGSQQQQHHHSAPHPAPHPAPAPQLSAPKITPKITPKPKPAPKPPVVKRPPLPKSSVSKRPAPIQEAAPKPPPKKQKKSPGPKKKKSPQLTEKVDRQRAAQTIAAVNAASGGKNDKAAMLAAAILRGVTMRPSGKWQAQLYFAGKSRYIGVFDTREKAALAYEIAREKLKSEKSAVDGALTPKQTENAVNAARKAAFDGVNEKG